MPFFDFRQNNSGGSFISDHVRGISLTVVVEAADYREANERAEMIGLYFDGAGDCSCCGNRWSEQWAGEDGDPVPSIYGVPLEEALPKRLGFAVDDIGGEEKPTVYVHFLSGAVGAY